MSMFRICDSLGYNTLQKYKKNPYLVIKKQIIYGISFFSALAECVFIRFFATNKTPASLVGAGV